MVEDNPFVAEITCSFAASNVFLVISELAFALAEFLDDQKLRMNPIDDAPLFYHQAFEIINSVHISEGVQNLLP